jgi:hypothetical protein
MTHAHGPYNSVFIDLQGVELIWEMGKPLH